MTQKFYQKASVQVAIISTLGLIIITLITIAHQRSQLKQDNDRLQADLSEKTSEVQRLETLLIPFRTIALERYTGTESEALAKLASRITELESLDQKRTLELDNLKKKVKKCGRTCSTLNINTYSSPARTNRKWNKNFTSIHTFKKRITWISFF